MSPVGTALTVLLVVSVSYPQVSQGAWLFNSVKAQPAVYYDDGNNHVVTVGLRQMLLQEKCQEWRVYYRSLWSRFCYSSQDPPDTKGGWV